MAAAAALSAAGTHAGVLVSLGGDMAVAGTAPDGGWRILVTEDSRTPSDGDGELIAIQGGAIATSSTTVRRWKSSEGVTVHHIVDPRTGLAADTPWRTATVVAATCELANGASTAAIVMGEDAPAWLEASGLPARLVANDGRVLRLGGWPALDRDRRGLAGVVTGPKGAGTDTLRVIFPRRGTRPPRSRADLPGAMSRCSTRSCGSRREAPAPCRCSCSPRRPAWAW